MGVAELSQVCPALLTRLVELLAAPPRTSHNKEERKMILNRFFPVLFLFVLESRYAYPVPSFVSWLCRDVDMVARDELPPADGASRQAARYKKTLSCHCAG